LLNVVGNYINRLIACVIQFVYYIVKFKKICIYFVMPRWIETSGVKDISKIDIFLNKVKKANDEN